MKKKEIFHSRYFTKWMFLEHFGAYILCQFVCKTDRYAGCTWSTHILTFHRSKANFKEICLVARRLCRVKMSSFGEICCPPLEAFFALITSALQFMGEAIKTRKVTNCCFFLLHWGCEELLRNVTYIHAFRYKSSTDAIVFSIFRSSILEEAHRDNMVVPGSVFCFVLFVFRAFQLLIPPFDAFFHS